MQLLEDRRQKTAKFEDKRRREMGESSVSHELNMEHSSEGSSEEQYIDVSYIHNEVTENESSDNLSCSGGVP